MQYTVLYTDHAGVSHFRDAKTSFEQVNFAPPAPTVGLTEYYDASKLVFFQVPAGWFGDWHPAPKRQFFCCLKGELELTVGDGEKRRFKAGDVFLLEDTVGNGHTTRVIGDDAFEAAVVQLAARRGF
jgi:hypothetical protein